MKTYAQTVITCVAVGTLSPLTAYRTLPRIVLFPVHSFSIRFRFHKNTSPLPRRRSPAPSQPAAPRRPGPSFPSLPSRPALRFARPHIPDALPQVPASRSQASARRNASKLLPTNAATPPLPAAHAGLFPVAPIPSRPSVSFHFLPHLCAAPPASSAQPRTNSPPRRSPALRLLPAAASHDASPRLPPDGRAVRDAGRPRRQTDSPFFDPVRQAGNVSAPMFRPDSGSLFPELSIVFFRQ